MRTKITFLILIFLSTQNASAQFEEADLLSRSVHSIQTNLLSFVRYQSAANLQYRYQNLEDRRGWIASIDIPFYLKNESEEHIHRYRSTVQFPTFNLKLMFTKNFGSVSEAYVGVGVDYGFNQYKHLHTVCLSSEFVNGTCICNQYDSNTFYSARHRAGMTLRFGVPLRFSPNYTGFIAFQSSFSYIFLPRINDRLYQNICGQEVITQPDKTILEVATFNAQNPDFSGAQGLFHIEFILPIKSFYR